MIKAKEGGSRVKEKQEKKGEVGKIKASQTVERRKRRGRIVF